MSATLQRDRAIQLAKTDPKQAHKIAIQISESWFKAQALASIIRYSQEDPSLYVTQAAMAASEGDDDYQRSAVRAWEVAALAERGLKAEARQSLNQAVKLARTVQPHSSRSEALMLLLQAAVAIEKKDAEKVYNVLQESCPRDEHWRCKRALRDGEQIIQGALEARTFYH